MATTTRNARLLALVAVAGPLLLVLLLPVAFASAGAASLALVVPLLAFGWVFAMGAAALAARGAIDEADGGASHCGECLRLVEEPGLGFCAWCGGWLAEPSIRV